MQSFCQEFQRSGVCFLSRRLSVGCQWGIVKQTRGTIGGDAAASIAAALLLCGLACAGRRRPIPPHINRTASPQLSGPPPVAAPPIVLLATPPPPRPITVVVPRMPEHVQPTTAPRGNVRWRRPVVYECKLCDGQGPAVMVHVQLQEDPDIVSVSRRVTI